MYVDSGGGAVSLLAPHAVLSAVPHPIMLLDETFTCIFVNPAATAFLRGTEADIVGRPGTDQLVPEDLEWALASVAFIGDNPDRSIPVVVRINRFDGSVCPMQVRLEALTAAIGDVHYILSLTDATPTAEIERFAADTISDVPIAEALQTLLRSTYATAPIPMTIHWTDGERVTGNWTQLDPRLDALVTDPTFRDVFERHARSGPEQVPCPPEFAAHGVRAICCAPIKVRGETVGAAAIWIEFEPPVGPGGVQLARHVANMAALAYVRRSDEAELRRRATTDPLTGALNRRAFLEIVRQIVDDGVGTTFVVDLDHFKPINDRFGHATGDEVLVEVARRINDILGAFGTVGRIGGDEFAAVIPLAMTVDEMSAKVKELVDALTAPIVTQSGLVTVGASIGRAAVAHGSTVERVMEAADQSMYREKRSAHTPEYLPRPL